VSDRLWDYLERLPGKSGARFDWDLALTEWPGYAVFARNFLQLTRGTATAVDCPTPCGLGCPRRIIRHAPEDIVALCDERRAPKLAVPAPQLAIYRLHSAAIGKAFAQALAIELRLSRMDGIPHTQLLGDFVAPDQQRYPVLMTLQDDPAAMDGVVRALCLIHASRFVLLAPTRQYLTPTAEQLLTTRGSLFLALNEIMMLADNGQFRLQRTESPFRALAPDHYAEPSDPLPANIFRQRGDQWEIRYQGGAVITLKQQKGLKYLTMLLASPGKSIPILDLYHLGKLDDEQRAMELGAGMEVGDRRALEDYWAAIKDVDEELQDAVDANDTQRVEELHVRKQRLFTEVSRMRKPGGQLRYANDPLRKPRDNVRSAIKRTMENLVLANMNDLVSHLQPLGVIQGGEIAYQPANPITWETQPISG
jgi:hypothetical protein